MNRRKVKRIVRSLVVIGASYVAAFAAGIVFALGVEFPRMIWGS